MKAPSLALLGLLAAWPTATPVLAQDLGARLASEFRPQQPIRVSIAGARLVGVFAGVTPDSLVVTQEGVARRLRLAELTGVWRRGTALRPGAIVGGALGLLGGAFLGVMIAAVCDAAECPDTFASGLAGGAAGGLLGAGAGALAGAAIPRWQRIRGFPP